MSINRPRVSITDLIPRLSRPGVASKTLLIYPDCWYDGGSQRPVYHSGVYLDSAVTKLIGAHDLNTQVALLVCFNVAAATGVKLWIANSTQTDGYRVEFVDEDTIEVFLVVASVDTSLGTYNLELPATSRWCSLTFVVDSGGVAVYVDGVEAVLSTDTTASVRTNTLRACYEGVAGDEFSAFHIISNGQYACSGLEPRSWTVPSDLVFQDEYLEFPANDSWISLIPPLISRTGLIVSIDARPQADSGTFSLYVESPDGADGIGMSVKRLSSGPNVYQYKQTVDSTTYDTGADDDFPLMWVLSSGVSHGKGVSNNDEIFAADESSYLAYNETTPTRRADGVLRITTDCVCRFYGLQITPEDIIGLRGQMSGVANYGFVPVSGIIPNRVYLQTLFPV